MLLGAAAQSMISYSGTSIKLCFHFIPSDQKLALVLHFAILTTLTPIGTRFLFHSLDHRFVIILVYFVIPGQRMESIKNWHISLAK